MNTIIKEWMECYLDNEDIDGLADDLLIYINHIESGMTVEEMMEILKDDIETTKETD